VKRNLEFTSKRPTVGRFFLYLEMKMRESAFMLRLMTTAIVMVLSAYNADSQTLRPSFSKFPAAVEKAQDDQSISRMTPLPARSIRG